MGLGTSPNTRNRTRAQNANTRNHNSNSDLPHIFDVTCASSDKLIFKARTHL